MQKHLQKLLLIVAMMVVPWVTQAQTLEGMNCRYGMKRKKKEIFSVFFVPMTELGFGENKRKSIWGILFGDETLVTLYQRPINSSYSFPM